MSQESKPTPTVIPDAKDERKLKSAHDWLKDALGRFQVTHCHSSIREALKCMDEVSESKPLPSEPQPTDEQTSQAFILKIIDAMQPAEYVIGMGKVGIMTSRRKEPIGAVISFEHLDAEHKVGDTIGSYRTDEMLGPSPQATRIVIENLAGLEVIEYQVARVRRMFTNPNFPDAGDGYETQLAAKPSEPAEGEDDGKYENWLIQQWPDEEDRRHESHIHGSKMRLAWDAAKAEKVEESSDLVEALTIIARWDEADFPVSGHFWDTEKTRPMRYGAAFGSNGERDYMRNIAAKALEAYRELKKRSVGGVK